MVQLGPFFSLLFSRVLSSQNLVRLLKSASSSCSHGPGTATTLCHGNVGRWRLHGDQVIRAGGDMPEAIRLDYRLASDMHKHEEERGR